MLPLSVTLRLLFSRCQSRLVLPCSPLAAAPCCCVCFCIGWCVKEDARVDSRSAFQRRAAEGTVAGLTVLCFVERSQAACYPSAPTFSLQCTLSFAVAMGCGASSEAAAPTPVVPATGESRDPSKPHRVTVASMRPPSAQAGPSGGSSATPASAPGLGSMRAQTGGPGSVASPPRGSLILQPLTPATPARPATADGIPGLNYCNADYFPTHMVVTLAQCHLLRWHKQPSHSPPCHGSLTSPLFVLLCRINVGRTTLVLPTTV